MNRFLLGALAMGAIFVLTSFTVSTRSEPARAVPGGPAWTVSQYQLDRAFRQQLAISSSVVLQMPSAGGIIITQVKGSPGSRAQISVNGANEDFDWNGPEQITYDLNPPIVVRPNEVLTISPTFGLPTVTIAGYTTLPGET